MFTHFCFNNIIIFFFFFFFFFSIFFFPHHRHLSVIIFAIFFPLFLSLSTSLLLSFIILFFFFFIIYIDVFPARNLTKNLTKKFDATNMTLKGGTSQACAACKYQRRKCSSECPLAPYFPPDQPKMFQNAHKLFGVSNILKILKNLDANQKSEAMRSIIYQANIRDRFPVHGCWGIICQLHYQIRQAEEDLHTVHTQLEMYRQHHQHQISSLTDDVPSQLELAMAPPSNALSLFGHNTPQTYNAAVNALPISQQHSYSNSSNAGYSSGYLDSKDHLGNSMWVQHPYGTINNNNNNPMAIQSELVVSQPLAIQQEVVQDYDEIHPFFDTIDDRQSYIDSKEAYESSSEESLKDTTQSIEHVAENELKSAAACFSLTSVN